LDPKVHYRAKNSPALVLVLRPINSVYAIPSHIFKTHINVISPRTPRLFKRYFFLHSALATPCTCHLPHPYQSQFNDI